MARINDNAYKLDFPGDYNISTTFNVTDLSPFDLAASVDLDSSTNHFQEEEDDETEKAQLNRSPNQVEDWEELNQGEDQGSYASSSKTSN